MGSLKLHILCHWTKYINKKPLEIRNEVERHKKHNWNFNSALSTGNIVRQKINKVRRFR